MCMQVVKAASILDSAAGSDVCNFGEGLTAHGAPPPAPTCTPPFLASDLPA